MTRNDGASDPLLTPAESRQWLANSNTVSKPGNLVDGGPVTLEMYVPTTTFATPERLTSFGGTVDNNPSRMWFFNLWIQHYVTTAATVDYCAQVEVTYYVRLSNLFDDTVEP